MGKLRAQIPNLITLCNLLSGALSILFLFKGMILAAALLIFAAAIFDVFDGGVARMLGVHSELGKELDSLADLISFGLAPSFIMYAYLEPLCSQLAPPLNLLVPCFALLLAAFTAVRLANFNISRPTTDYFRGLPCPASGLVIASLPLACRFNPVMGQLLTGSLLFLFVLTAALCALMVSGFRLLSLKFHGHTWKLNEARFLFVGATLTGMAILKFAAVPLILMLYFSCSYLHNRWNKTRQEQIIP